MRILLGLRPTLSRVQVAAPLLRRTKVAITCIAETVDMTFAGFVEAYGRIMDLALAATMLAISMKKRRTTKNSKTN